MLNSRTTVQWLIDSMEPHWVRNDNNWIATVSGRQFWPTDARPEEVHIEDIALSLSHICRFTGHTRVHYSVAQHSVLVSRLCEENGVDPKWGLMHDAAEAYLADIASPVKHLIPLIDVLEDRLLVVIAKRFGLPEQIPDGVKFYDTAIRYAEKRDLMTEGHPWSDWGFPTPAMEIVPQPCETAERMFLARFRQLFG